MLFFCFRHAFSGDLNVGIMISTLKMLLLHIRFETLKCLVCIESVKALFALVNYIRIVRIELY